MRSYQVLFFFSTAYQPFSQELETLSAPPVAPAAVDPAQTADLFVPVSAAPDTSSSTMKHQGGGSGSICHRDRRALEEAITCLNERRLASTSRISLTQRSQARPRAGGSYCPSPAHHSFFSRCPTLFCNTYRVHDFLHPLSLDLEDLYFRPQST
ncbi:hypothetical protein FLONG3_7234 [Fusarium longipes]|uniref:Uncharacterized protein n=1 Tax=Fusarium longipes TaxID=694270 RepID=A0A395SFA9_9HYPO|nr:hypothetical protein FLONG3_7234 [Fusarium longipes]